MSHTMNVQIEMHDRVAILSACKRLGIKTAEGTHKLYSSAEEGLGVFLDGWKYPIVIKKDGSIAYDNYNGQWGSEKKLSELLHQLDNGVFMKPGKTTLAEYLEKWLKDYAWANLAPRTAEGYEHIIHRHIIPSLGKITLSQLKPEHLQSYYAEKLNNGR